MYRACKIQQHISTLVGEICNLRDFWKHEDLRQGSHNVNLELLPSIFKELTSIYKISNQNILYQIKNTSVQLYNYFYEFYSVAFEPHKKDARSFIVKLDYSLRDLSVTLEGSECRQISRRMSKSVSNDS